VQRFVDGREVNVGILGDRALPVAEIDFGHMPPGLWRIVSYRSKWEEGSDEDLGAMPRCPAELPPALEAEITSLALAAWRLVGGDGYGRVDFRIDRRGRPWLLEVNANPDISPHAGLARMARAAGLDYTALVREVCDRATARTRHAVDACWSLAQQLSGVTPAAPAPAARTAANAGRGVRLLAVGDH
jgi:D-alanine-D-alanine ligase